MNIIEQLVNLTLNDKLAQCDIADNQRVVCAYNSNGFVRVLLTDGDMVQHMDMYYFTGPIIRQARHIINGDENLQGFMLLTEMMKHRFKLPHNFNVDLADRLKYLRTVERMESKKLHTGDINPLNIKPDDRRFEVPSPKPSSKDDQIIELLTDIRDLLGTIRDEK